MSDIICVTNRHLCMEEGPDRRTEGKEGCGERFLKQIERLARCRPAAILLREKDLSEAEYEVFARQVLAVCAAYGVPCILHTYADVAARLCAPALHLSLPDLRALRGTQGVRPGETMPDCAAAVSAAEEAVPAYGVSVHAVGEAREAERLGCSYILAGHVFDTACKDGLPGRGLSFLREVCGSVSVPVLAIGGINAENRDAVRRTGVAGICVMSGAMRCADAKAYLGSLR